MVDYEDKYYALSNGKIWSRKRKVKAKNDSLAYRGGYYMKGSNVKGYRTINIRISPTKLLTRKVHRLIAKTFIINPFNKPHINHIDGNKQNNDISNLEWVTPAENSNHAMENELLARGENNGNSKFTSEQIREMRRYHKTERKRGEKTWEKYNMDMNHYYDIIKRKYWNWLED